MEDLKERYARHRSVRMLFIAVVAVVAVALVFVSLTIGTRSMDISYVYDLVLDHIAGVTYDRDLQYQLWYDDIIVWDYRLPRAIFAIIAGAGLAVAGAAMQSVMKNPLADPYTTGISSGALLGVAIEKVAYTPLRSAPRLSLLITAIGISFLLENGAQLLFGSDTKSMVQEPLISGNLTIGSVSITYAAIITILVSIVSMIALTILVQKTKLGKAMRAVSEDMGAAQLMGISLNRTISFTFAVGSALAGIGSVLHIASYFQASPMMGSMLGLKAFVAAVLGGIGSIPGAMIGGFAIGIVETLVTAAGLSTWKDGVVFAILIVVLLLKPTGILGKKITEKV